MIPHVHPTCPSISPVQLKNKEKLFPLRSPGKKNKRFIFTVPEHFHTNSCATCLNSKLSKRLSYYIKHVHFTILVSRNDPPKQSRKGNSNRSKSELKIPHRKIRWILTDTNPFFFLPSRRGKRARFLINGVIRRSHLSSAPEAAGPNSDSFQIRAPSSARSGTRAQSTSMMISRWWRQRSCLMTRWWPHWCDPSRALRSRLTMAA